MFDSELPSDARDDRGGLAKVRGRSEVNAAFGAVHGDTRIARIFERGSFRLRFPRGRGCEAVLINTGGGITGGDRLDVSLELGVGATVVATSQAAEKLYRSDGAAALIALRARLGDASRLMWLPQESILFDGAIVQRLLEIEMPATAKVTAAEILTLGRTAHGERITNASWRDRWRIIRDGRLLLAENVRIDGAISELMERPALGAGARCLATLVHVAPDAEARLGDVRDALAAVEGAAAASAWNGMLVARFAGTETHKTRAAVAAAVVAATGDAMPRAWSC